MVCDPDCKDVVTIDVSNITDAMEIQEALKEKLDFPDFYCLNWNAFWIVITGLAALWDTMILLDLRNLNNCAKALQAIDIFCVDGFLKCILLLYR